MLNLSVVVSAYNEEENIRRCLLSVSSFASEIVVVNNSSEDKTAEIVSEFTKKIYLRPNYLMLNKNKNFGLKKATSDWILYLDADEEVTKDLKDEIIKILKNDNHSINGFWMSRKNIIFGKWIRHGIWWPDKQIRLIRNGSGLFPQKHIHEHINVTGATGNLKYPLVHYNYDSVGQYLKTLDRCTTSESDWLADSDYQFAWYDALRFPISDFVKIYFAQESYKDGLHGLVLALFQSFYSFVTFAKLWEKNKFAERDIKLSATIKELQKNASEIRYWKYSVNIKNTTSPVKKIVLKIRRKFGL